MKLAVSSYSFSQLIRAGDENQLSVIKLAADMGFDGIEFTDLCPENGMSQIEYAAILKEEAKKQNIEITNYAISANLIADDIEAEITRLKGQVDVAHALGAKFMRHDAFYSYPKGMPQEFDFYLDKVVSACRKVTDYAQTLGVKTMTENHGFISQDADRVEKIIKGVNSENFGWLVDIGNFLCVDQSPVEAVSIAAKYAFYVHAKDFYRFDKNDDCIVTRGGNFIRGASVGDGIVPVEECLGILASAGYDGYLSIEYEGKEPCIKSIMKGLEFLHEHLKG